MQTAQPETPTTPQSEPTAAPQAEKIPIHERFVLWMFLLVFIFFGIILLGDLLSGLFR